MGSLLRYVVVFFVIILFLHPDDGSTHQPHDNIDAFDISPSYHLDGTLFAVVDSYSLKRSTDQGDTWKDLSIGLDNKAEFSSISISPSYSTDGTVFVGSRDGEIYYSTNGGYSWVGMKPLPANLSIEFVLCSPDYLNDQTLFVSCTKGGVYKSVNRGESWYSVLDEGIEVTALAFSPDYVNDNLLFAGDDTGTLYYSSDRGETWVPTSRKLTVNKITSIAVSPTFPSDRTMFIGTYGDGIFKSTDQGRSFVEANQGVSDKFITSLAISPEYLVDSVLFAASANEAVFRSGNGGLSWDKHSWRIYYRPQGDVHYRNLKISSHYGKDKTIFLAAFEGLFKSVDGGRRWIEKEILPTKTISGIAIAPDFSLNSTLILSTYGGGAYKSTDGGENWSVQNVGLERPFLYDIILSPYYTNDDTLFALQIFNVAISTNKGETWALRKISTTQEVFPTVILASPGFSMDDTLFIASRYHGVFKSMDRGGNWSLVFNEVKNTRSLAISPDFVSDGTLYVGTLNDGIYMTTDGGLTWQPVNSGLTCLERVVLAISPNFTSDGTLFAGTKKGLFKSTDRGRTWTLLGKNDYLSNGVILAIGVSPNYEFDGEALISIQGVGLFKTSDHGNNWSPVAPELIENYRLFMIIRFSPNYSVDGTIYGATQTELLRSIDGGETWQHMLRPVAYEDKNDFLIFMGKWSVLKEKNHMRAQSITYSNVAGSRAYLSFVGSGIDWIGMKSDQHGVAGIYIDGVFKEFVDLYHPEPGYMEEVYSIRLPYGVHTISIEVTGQKNPLSSNGHISIDALDIVP